MRRDEVYDAIDSERRFQDQRWGTIQEHPHEVGAWILLIEKLAADARQAWAKSAGDRQALEEIRKVGAVAVACGEQHGFTSRPAIAYATRFGPSAPNPFRKDNASLSPQEGTEPNGDSE